MSFMIYYKLYNIFSSTIFKIAKDESTCKNYLSFDVDLVMPSGMRTETSSFLLAVADFSHLVLEFAFIYFSVLNTLKN